MNASEKNCPFCSVDSAFARNRLAIALEDRNPVNRGHSLIIPIRHVESFFDTTSGERAAILELSDEVRAILDRKYQPDGYNLGINVGAAAGQTVFHVHLHVIPRFLGDVANPRGGVRGVIPARQSY
jgi:diadenosine tetraphosphate (Ap4A) HIT family hydrolase